MKIKLLTSRSGPDGTNAPGEVVDVSAAEAARLLDSNQAEAVEAPAKIKTAATRSAKKKTAAEAE